MSLHFLIALGSEPSSAVVALAWLLTYVAHAMIWGATAALVVRWRALASSTKSYLWLAAVLGPLMTTALGASSWPSLSGPSSSRELEVFATSDRIASRRAASPHAGAAVDPSPSAAETHLGWSNAGARSSSVPAPFSSTHPGVSRVEGAGTPPLAATTGGDSRDADSLSPMVQWPTATTFLVELSLSSLIAILSLATLLGCLRFFATLVSLQRRLRARTPVTDSRLLERLERLRSRAGLRAVTLTQSAAVDVPLVLGRSEICIPLASLLAESDAEVDAVFAHELAHIERRDGIVFPLVGLVQTVLWWQPLNLCLAARFRQAAELASDDRAVELTGDPLALARALARVASDASPTGFALTPAMARAQSASVLVARVRRLAHARSGADSRPRGGWAIATVIAIAIVTSSVSVRAARTPSPPSGVRVARKAALDSSAAVGATERSAALVRTGQQLESEIDAQQRTTTPHSGESEATAVGATERVAELVRREQHLVTEIARLSRTAAQHSGDSASQILELQQQLRHVRETAAWVERTFVGESSP